MTTAIPYRESHLGAAKAREYDSDLWDSRAAKGLTWELERQLLGRILDTLPEQPRTAVDFACGTGRLLSFLSGRGIDVTGVDVSPDMLAIARLHAPGARLVEGDVTRDPDLVTAQYDLATAFRFFLNADPSLRAGALRWLRRSVRPGGRLVVNFHLNPYSARGLYTRARQRGDAAQSTMSVNQVRRLLRMGGFRTLSVHGYDFLPYRRDGRAMVAPRLRAKVESALLDHPTLGPFGGTFIVVAEPDV